jgi:S1-C subfamily serine protease
MAENIWAALSSQIAETTATTGKSIVAIHGRRHPSSGIIIASDAVVTASHALRREEDITVVLSPEKRTTARLVGRDPNTDLAVLRLAQPVEAPAVRWGQTATLRVGELVVAVARTWRGNLVASSGILSGLMGAWRTWRGGDVDQFIRPDLNLYPGFSGGALINAQGEVLGLNTSGLHRSGLTIPAATVQRVCAELLEKGQVERPWLGLAMQAVPLPESLRARLNLTGSEALLVAHVEPGSAAEKAGVLLGDVLIEMDSKPVADTDAVQDVLRRHRVGDQIAVKLIRGGAVTVLTITLGARSR